ncbi:MAG: cyclase family protein [Nitrososphaerales archaeon]
MLKPARLIDITLPFSERLPVWPGDAAVQISRSTGVAMVSELRMSSHVGTHVDAPAHFIPGGLTVDRLPLDLLIGPAYVAGIGGTSVITSQTLDGARIPAGVTRLLLNTSYAHFELESRRKKHRTSQPNEAPESQPFDKNYVGLDASAAGWLLDRGVRLIGINTPSVDTFTSTEFPVHQILLINRVIIVENLQLRDVKTGRYRLICLPLAYEGGDGAPVRAVLETISDE